MSLTQTRRSLLATLSSAAAVALIGSETGSAQEAPPEVTTIRLAKVPGICIAPQYVAEGLLKIEGFNDIQYVEVPLDAIHRSVGTDKIDMSMGFILNYIVEIDSDTPIKLLAGVHAGCFELFGTKRVNAIRDLKGKTVAVYALGGGDHILLSSMLAYVGMDPRKDVKWLAEKTGDAMQFFIDGKADAFMGFAPQPLQLRAKKIGHVIINTAQELNALPYNRWRESNPEDTLRFHALRLHEVGMIKASPQKLIAQGTDWRFLNELKKELKA